MDLLAASRTNANASGNKRSRDSPDATLSLNSFVFLGKSLSFNFLKFASYELISKTIGFNLFISFSLESKNLFSRLNISLFYHKNPLPYGRGLPTDQLVMLQIAYQLLLLLFLCFFLLCHCRITSPR